MICSVSGFQPADWPRRADCVQNPVAHQRWWQHIKELLGRTQSFPVPVFPGSEYLKSWLEGIRALSSERLSDCNWSRNSVTHGKKLQVSTSRDRKWKLVGPERQFCCEKWGAEDIHNYFIPRMCVATTLWASSTGSLSYNCVLRQEVKPAEGSLLSKVTRWSPFHKVSLCPANSLKNVNMSWSQLLGTST